MVAERRSKRSKGVHDVARCFDVDVFVVDGEVFLQGYNVLILVFRKVIYVIVLCVVVFRCYGVFSNVAILMRFDVVIHTYVIRSI